MSQLRYRSCTLCESNCGLVLEIEGARARSVRGDADDPHSQGFLCPKPGVASNFLADANQIDVPTGNAVLTGIPVEISASARG